MKRKLTIEDIRIGGWLSAALDDQKVCDLMKADIRAWMETFEYSNVLEVTEETSMNYPEYMNSIGKSFKEMIE